MQRSDFTEQLKQWFSDILDLNATKGNDYSGSEDAFANFKRNAQRLDMSPHQVWAVYFFKHLDAIETWLRDGQVKSEPIEGRIDDAIMYLFLLKGMILEREQETRAFELGEDTETKPKVIESDNDLMQEIKRTTHFSSLGPVGNYTNPQVATTRGTFELTDTGWVMTH